MAIMVKFNDGSFGRVANRDLDDVIEKRLIISFRRESGWAEIGRDPIRGTSVPQVFDGPDRRASAEGRNCLTCAQFVGSLCRSSDCSFRTSSQAKEVEKSSLS